MAMAETMQKTSPVIEVKWKSDVIKNNFRCGCGNEVRNPDGSFKNLLMDTTWVHTDILCDKCRKVLATIDAPVDKAILQKFVEGRHFTEDSL